MWMYKKFGHFSGFSGLDIFLCFYTILCFFIMQVVVNGETYQPSIASENKKKAKADAATAALQQLGLLEKDPNNPL